MPQLPSGRHIGITANPFVELMEHIEEGNNYELFTSIKSVEDILQHVEVVYFVEAQTEDEVPTAFVVTAKLPSGLKQVSSGYRLSQKEQMYLDWQIEDQVAFDAFIAIDSIQSHIRKCYAEVESLRSKAFVSLFTKYATKAGLLDVDDDPLDVPELDTFDLVAALGCCYEAAAKDEALYNNSTQAFDRLSGMWQLLTGILSLADYEFSDEQHPRLIANKMREDNLFEKLIPEKIEWLEKQVQVEAVELWSHADEEQLRDYCPRAYAILQLAVAMNSED